VTRLTSPGRRRARRYSGLCRAQKSETQSSSSTGLGERSSPRRLLQQVALPASPGCSRASRAHPKREAGRGAGPRRPPKLQSPPSSDPLSATPQLNHSASNQARHAPKRWRAFCCPIQLRDHDRIRRWPSTNAIGVVSDHVVALITRPRGDPANGLGFLGVPVAVRHQSDITRTTGTAPSSVSEALN
jgi:hypothetical protein